MWLRGNATGVFEYEEARIEVCKLQEVFGIIAMKCEHCKSVEWEHPLTKKIRCGYCYDRNGVRR